MPKHLQTPRGQAAPAVSIPSLKPSLPSFAPPAVRAATQGGGQALDSRTSAEMSAKFGHSFSQVRVHTDSRAGDAADAMGANAFALGGDIVFGAGKYQPGSSDTDRLLAHELTHVVQQSQFGMGDWGRTSHKGDASEREADSLASQVMLGRGVSVQAAPGAAVARDGDGEQDGPLASVQPDQSQERNYVDAIPGYDPADDPVAVAQDGEKCSSDDKGTGGPSACLQPDQPDPDQPNQCQAPVQQSVEPIIIPNDDGEKCYSTNDPNVPWHINLTAPNQADSADPISAEDAKTGHDAYEDEQVREKAIASGQGIPKKGAEEQSEESDDFQKELKNTNIDKENEENGWDGPPEIEAE